MAILPQYAYQPVDKHAAPTPATSRFVRAAIKAVGVAVLLVTLFIILRTCMISYPTLSVSVQWKDASLCGPWCGEIEAQNAKRIENDRLLSEALQRLKQFGPRLRSDIARRDPKANSTHFGSCAVVGESTSLYTGPRLFAEEIDAHDAVIRLPPVESLMFYRDRQVPFRGKKATVEVHFEGNKTNWLTAPGTHGLCGVHTNTSVLLMPSAKSKTTLAKLRQGCNADQALIEWMSFVHPKIAAAMYELQDALNQAVTFPGSVLNFTEEWLVTYSALALCDSVDLYGVIMEPTVYGYDPSEMHKDADDKPKTVHPAHWAAALAKLGVRDHTYDALMESMRRPDAREPLPDNALDFVRDQLEAGRAKLREKMGSNITGLGQSCIVMGASSDLYQQGKGEWIDSHDSVWRCNQHIPDSHDAALATDHGARTDVVVTLRPNLMNPDLIKRFKALTADANPNATAYVYPPPELKDPPINTPLVEGKDFEFVRWGYADVVYAFIDSIAPTTQHPGGWAYHSTGHFAVNMALLSCDSASAAGFGLGRLTLYHHLFTMEGSMLELYRQAGLMDVFMPEDVRAKLQVYLRNMYNSGVLRIPHNYGINATAESNSTTAAGASVSATV